MVDDMNSDATPDADVPAADASQETAPPAPQDPDALTQFGTAAEGAVTGAVEGAKGAWSQVTGGSAQAAGQQPDPAAAPPAPPAPDMPPPPVPAAPAPPAPPAAPAAAPQPPAAPPVAPPAPPAPPTAPQPTAYAAPAAAAAAQPCPKSKVAAGILGILLGSLGIHKFYLGYTTAGIIMLAVSIVSFGMLAGIMGIIGLIEGIIYLTKTDDQFCQEYVYNQKPWF